MQSRTLLSILVAIVAIAALIGFIAVVIFSNRSRLTPDEVVGNFFDQWVTVLRAAPPTPFEQGLHEKSTYVTGDFGRSVNAVAARGSDAVLCLGKAPENFELLPAAISDDQTRAAARFRADGASGRAVLIRDERGWWRIDEIDCETDLSRPAATTTPAVATSSTATGTPGL